MCRWRLQFGTASSQSQEDRRGQRRPLKYFRHQVYDPRIMGFNGFQLVSMYVEVTYSLRFISMNDHMNIPTLLSTDRQMEGLEGIHGMNENGELSIDQKTTKFLKLVEQF